MRARVPQPYQELVKGTGDTVTGDMKAQVAPGASKGMKETGCGWRAWPQARCQDHGALLGLQSS